MANHVQILAFSCCLLHKKATDHRQSFAVQISQLFSQIAVLESLPPGEVHTGHKIHEDLLTLNSAFRHKLSIRYADVRDIKSFWSSIDQLVTDAQVNGHYPILHLECHGSTDQKGIVLADSSFLSWADLKPKLIQINIQTRCNLLIVLASCNGGYLAEIMNPTDRAPCWGLVGAARTASATDLLAGFATFYRELLSSLDGDRAIHALQQTSPSADFRFIPAEGFFMRAFAGYLRTYSNPKAIDGRAKGIARKLHKMGASARKGAVKSMLRDIQKPSFYKYARRFFMVDLFPENASRFSVSYENAVVQSRTLT